ncbi:hypothetical protein ACQ4M3_08525 [Leptolyngbya sp. AN03gr2]|uniref:hypothetical protein n=1 Tax=unclassified Leptolyngbya TaxID=2650499 RepID=UPI003D311E1E
MKTAIASKFTASTQANAAFYEANTAIASKFTLFLKAKTAIASKFTASTQANTAFHEAIAVFTS